MADWFPDPPTDPSLTYNSIRKARLPIFTAETDLRFARNLLQQPAPQVRNDSATYFKLQLNVIFQQATFAIVSQPSLMRLNLSLGREAGCEH